jgi:hypothetical protein
MNITSPSVRHTQFTVGIPKDQKTLTTITWEYPRLDIEGIRVAGLLIKYPRFFNSMQIEGSSLAGFSAVSTGK